MQTALQIAWIVGEAEQAGHHLHGHRGPAVAAADQVAVQDAGGVREGARPGGPDRRRRPGAGEAPADPEQDPGQRPEQRRRRLHQRRAEVLRRQQAASSPSPPSARSGSSRTRTPTRSTWPTRRSAPTTPTRTGRRSRRSTRPTRPRRTRAASAPTSCRAPSSSRSTTTSSRRPLHEIQGPVVTPTGNFVFEVITATPEHVQGFDDTAASHQPAEPAGKISDQIKQQIKSQQQQEALTAFGQHFRDYWTNLTQCAQRLPRRGLRQLQRRLPDLRPVQARPVSAGTVRARDARPPSSPSARRRRRLRAPPAPADSCSAPAPARPRRRRARSSRSL